MSELEIPALVLAKEYQIGIEFTQNPMDVALMGHNAAFELRQSSDERLQEGPRVRIHALGAYVLEQWDEEKHGYVTVKFEEVVADGDSMGVSFIQHAPDPELSTLFIGLTKTTLLEVEGTEVGRYVLPRLVLPIRGVDSVEVIAA
jgi:hypothetical protein